jgi:hypothetical protein
LKKLLPKKRQSQTSSRPSTFTASKILPGNLKFSSRSGFKIGSERESQQVEAPESHVESQQVEAPESHVESQQVQSAESHVESQQVQSAESDVESQQVQSAESDVENPEFEAAENNAYKIINDFEAKLNNNLKNGEYDELKRNFNLLEVQCPEKLVEFSEEIKKYPELKEAEEHRKNLSKAYSEIIKRFALTIQAVEAQPQELGTDKEGSTAVNKRPQVELAMGQGVAANLGQLILYSKNFSTCSPIVMFNKTTKIGGLFHFPAGQLDQNKPSIKAMYNKIQLTEIHLDARELPKAGYYIEETESYNTYKKDVKNLKGFLEEYGFATNDFRLINLPTTAYAITLGEDGENVLIDSEIHSEVKALSVEDDRTEENRQRIEKEWQGSPSATKYGIDDWNI